MTINADALVSDYVKWIKDNTATRIMQDSVQITTPFLDRHNDHLQIYVQKSNDDLYLSDDGYTIQELEMAGIKLDSERRKTIIKQMLASQGVRLNVDTGELYVHTNEGKFPIKKHALLQAMISISDLFMTSRPIVMSLFTEEVALFLLENEIPASEGMGYVGKSGIFHKFDFSIPPIKKKPAQYIQTINRVDKNNTTSTIFSWNDTTEARKASGQLFVLVNDVEQKVNKDLLKAYDEYGIGVEMWSNRDRFLKKLA